MTWLVEAIHWVSVIVTSHREGGGVGSGGLQEPVLIRSANEDNTFSFCFKMYIKKTRF